MLILNNLSSWFKKDPLIHSIFLAFGIISLLAVCAVGYFYLRFFVLDKYYESIIDKKFHAEIANIPQIKVTKFMLWEGDSIVTLEVQNKGSVSFWYGRDGVPRIEGIEPYSIPFVCFYVDNQGSKLSYAYDFPLDLGKNTKVYEKWFRFKVNNLHDLVDKYDSIIQVLNTFPKNPEMTDFYDKKWGKHSVVKNPDPEFILRDKYAGKSIACDLYVRTKLKSHP